MLTRTEYVVRTPQLSKGSGYGNQFFGEAEAFPTAASRYISASTVLDNGLQQLLLETF